MGRNPLSYTIPLGSIPDFSEEKQAVNWIFRQLDFLKTFDFSNRSNDLISFSSNTFSINTKLGILSSSIGRRFTLAVLLADWACYTDEADQVDYIRLKNILSSFPSGFRVWMKKVENNTYIPVGYTGWYPIQRHIFKKLVSQPEKITSRAEIIPIKGSRATYNFIYIFNYSIISQLQKTVESKRLIQTLADDLNNIVRLGLAAITVSQEGQRIAKRFGLHHAGSITHQGQKEDVFANEFTAYTSSHEKANTERIVG